MRSMNRVVIVGTLGRDPEFREATATRSAWCTFSVATNRRRREGDGWTEVTDWHDVRAFGAEAEACHRFLRKGHRVGVEGSLTYDRWQDDHGQRRISSRVLADRVSFLERPNLARPEVIAQA